VRNLSSSINSIVDIAKRLVGKISGDVREVAGSKARLAVGKLEIHGRLVGTSLETWESPSVTKK